jgi:hypothetical protein
MKGNSAFELSLVKVIGSIRHQQQFKCARQKLRADTAPTSGIGSFPSIHFLLFAHLSFVKKDISNNHDPEPNGYKYCQYAET